MLTNHKVQDTHWTNIKAKVHGSNVKYYQSPGAPIRAPGVTQEETVNRL